MPDRPAPTIRTSTCSGFPPDWTGVRCEGARSPASTVIVRSSMGTGRRGADGVGSAARVARLCRRHVIDTLSSESTGCRDTASRPRILAACQCPPPTARAPPADAVPTRPSGDDRELAILATAERLLAERPLAAISVDDLARGAGISRPTLLLLLRVEGRRPAHPARPGRRPRPTRPRRRGVRRCRPTGAREGWRAGHHRLLRDLPRPPGAHPGLGRGAVDQRRGPGAVGARSSRPGCSAAPTAIEAERRPGRGPAGHARPATWRSRSTR